MYISKDIKSTWWLYYFCSPTRTYLLRQSWLPVVSQSITWLLLTINKSQPIEKTPLGEISWN